MAFVAEDGTGLANANSYATIAFADEYFADRGITAWTGDDTVKQQKLVQATDYLETRFTFDGVPYSEEQALHFPILDDATGEPAELPVNLLKATAEYALRALSAPLAPDPTVDATGGRVIAKTEKVGPLEETTQYSPTAAIQRFRPYPAADILLKGLVVDTSNQVIR